jgi:hypothetical protein
VRHDVTSAEGRPDRRRDEAHAAIRRWLIMVVSIKSANLRTPIPT